MIRLEEITNKNVWKVCKLKPFPDQEDFVASNIESMAEAFATRNEGNIAHPLAIYNDSDLIGFVMIGKGTVGNEESELIKNNYSIWRFMIDKNFQGKGLGKLALDEIVRFIKTFPYGEAKHIWLSYEKENLHAKEIYSKYGFIENGEMCDDEIIAVYDL